MERSGWTPMQRRRSTWRALTPALLGLPLSGCRPEPLLAAQDRAWLWLVVPLVGFTLVAGSAALARRRGRSRTAPRLLLASVIGGLLAALAFALYNLSLEIDPWRKMWNVGLWFLGTIGGAVGVTLLEGRRADGGTPQDPGSQPPR